MLKILNNLRKRTLMLSLLIVFLAIPSTSVALNEVNSGLRVSSTIAGFDTYYDLTTGGNYDLFLVSPNGSRTAISSKYSKIDGKYLKKSGSYSLVAASKVSTGLFGSKYKIEAQSKFDVLADNTVAKRSKVEFLAKPTVGTEVLVSVTLKDQYGNVVEGNEVSLLADNDAAVSKIGSNVSNEDGKVLFKYMKLDEGKDKVLAMDKSDDVLISTIEVSKFAAASVFGFGGDVVGLADGDRFEFNDVPTTVEPYEAFDFTLRALDAGQELDDSYTGTVRFFSATNDDAVVPDDYIYDALDDGEAIFLEEAYFTEEGTHTLDVVDVDNELLLGSIEIEVEFSGADEGEEIIGEGGSLKVTSPTSGISNSSVVNFKGSTDPGLEVSVFDDGVILVAEDADSNGNFDFNSPVLADGVYLFTISDGVGVSGEIKVTIDTSGSILSSIELDPSNVSANGAVSFEIDLSVEASRVSVVIDEQRNDLVQSDTIGKSFTGVVNAPTSSGSYAVDLIVVDKGGESTTLKGVSNIQVGSGGGGITFNVPSQVLNVNVQPGDRRVTLLWDAAFDNTGISNYKINYGIDPNLLLSSVSTNDSSTTWYVPNLSNDTKYYFQIFGVDTEGNLSDQGSQVVSATPSSIYGGGLHGSGDGQVTVNQVTESGPGVYVLLIFAAFLAYWFRLDKKLA